MEQTSLTKLVALLDSMSYEQLPSDIRAMAKEFLADFLGIFCSSTKKPMSCALYKALSPYGALPERAEDIAMWIASSARMLDMDDGHRFAMAHPGVVIHAAAVAMAMTLPKEQVTGQKIIEAIVKGYEVYCWQGRVINPSAYLERGIDATSACGAGASATVAGTLMGLDPNQLADAISLAAAVIGGLNQSAIDGSAQKYLVAGFGAKVGIAAAQMAAYGLGGPSHVFEGKLGYVNAFSAHPDHELLDEPKLHWDIQYVYLKIHACVRRIHATLDAVSKILEQEKIGLPDIDKVLVFGGPFLCDAGTYDPKDSAQAQTSVPYAVANLLKFGIVQDDLMEENLNNPEISVISRKVIVLPDKEIAEMTKKDKSLWGAARVRIELTDGRFFEQTKIIPNGDRESPFPPGTIQKKFIQHVQSVTNGVYAAQLWNTIAELETAPCPADTFCTMMQHLKEGAKI